MKSVIVQGATVAKAIDEALAKAGMPQEFFIKILEEAQPGFLGFGSKKAKIALFFKKDNGRRDGSLLSRGTYKNLFDNESLQAQSAEQERQDKIVEKKEVVSTPQQYKAEAQSPRKVEAQQLRKVEVQHPRKVEQRPQKVENRQQQTNKIADQPCKVEAKPIILQQEQKKQVPQRVPMQRVLNQRPLKFATPKIQETDSVASSVAKQSVQTVSILEPVKTDVERTELQNKRPRRRRRYGYRSKAPIQWGKNQDEPEQSTDERRDSESK